MPMALKSPLLILLSQLLLNAATCSGALKSSALKEREEVCQSIECVSLAAEMASRMNLSADPCQDFYNFACGHFPSIVKYNPAKVALMSAPRFSGDILIEDTIGLMTERLEKNIYELLVLDRVATSQDPDIAGLYNFTRAFYRSCRSWLQDFLENEVYLNDNGELSARFLRAVYAHLNRTMREMSRNGATLSTESMLAALVKGAGVGILSMDLPSTFAEEVIGNEDFNLTKTARALIQLRADHFMGTLNGMEPSIHNLVSFLENANLAIPELNRLSANKSQMLIDTYDDLRATLSEPLRTENCSLGGVAWTQLYTVAELDAFTACVSPGDPFSWTLFFQELIQTPVDPRAIVQVVQATKVIQFVSFFKSRQSASLSATRKLTAKGSSTKGSVGIGSVSQYSTDEAFLIVDWLLSFAAFIPKKLQGSLLYYKPQVANIPKSDSVSICMMWTKNFLQPIVERMYQRAYHREDFRDVNRLVQLIKDASVQSVRQQSWITPSAKVAIVKKIQSMKQSIGLDDITASQLKSFYNETLTEFRRLNSSSQRTFGRLMSLALCAYAKKNLDIMTGGSPVSLFMDVSPLVVNAYNWLRKNEIIFPMAILAAPVYHPNYPDYINLGSLGYIIGHEIGHSFDDMGHTINQKGASGHFWDNKTEERYLERMECVRSRFGSYTLYPGGPAHHSNSTLGNDIADIIGIRAATEALKMLKRGRRTAMPRMPNLQTRFSPEQMLFIQAAQGWCIKSEPNILKLLFSSSPSHSPHYLRIRGIVENSEDFAEAFRCRRGAPMNPAKKCTFW